MALVAARHEFQGIASEWFGSLGSGDLVVCRLAHLGCMRLIGNRHVMGGDAVSVNESIAVWNALARDPRVRIEHNEPIGVGEMLTTLTRGRDYRSDLWSDAYLAAFAISSRLPIVTFDKGFGSFDGLEVLLLRKS